MRRSTVRPGRIRRNTAKRNKGIDLQRALIMDVLQERLVNFQFTSHDVAIGMNVKWGAEIYW